MHRVGGMFVFFVRGAPQGGGAVHAIFIYGIEKYVKGGQLLFVVFVVVRHAAHAFEARFRG